MSKKILTISFLFATLFADATIRYATNHTGLSSGSGLTPATALSFTYAISSSGPVVPGDIVYCTAAVTYTGNPVFQISGTCGNPIQFIGYSTIPGETIQPLVNAANPYATYTTTAMPTFVGTNRNTGICFDVRSRNYLIIKNFQITAYEYGVIGGAADTTSNIELNNVNVNSIGDRTNSYSGFGILMGSMGTKWADRNTLINCLVVNAAAEGIDLDGDKNYISGCKVYCNESNIVGYEQTDYYMMCSGNYNEFSGCYIERASAVADLGEQSVHGFSAKTNAEQVIDAGLPYPTITAQYNSFINCTARNINEGFAFRHRLSKYNLVYHCYAYGTHSGSDASAGSGNGVTIRDGASYNLVDGLIVDSCETGINFDDTSEDGDTGGSPPGHPGNYNVIKNSTFSNCYIPISFSDNGAIASDAGINTIANCTFYLTRYLHYAGRRCTSMVYSGNIYYGNSVVGSGGYFRGYTYSSDVVVGQFSKCSSYNQQGGMPFALTFTVNPTFVNGTTRDFRLQASSGLINGNTTATAITNPMELFSTPFNKLSVLDNTQYNTKDYNGIPRWTFGGYPDVGAFEYH